MKFNRQSFFSCFRAYHKAERNKSLTQSQVDGLTFLLDAIEQDPAWKLVTQVSYFLATCAHETAWTFKPIKEYRGKTLSPQQKKYWPSGYYGRGYVQLTWGANYEDAGRKLGIDLADSPDLALEPETAYQIAARGMREGWFTGKSLDMYFGNVLADYKNARRIVNGLDKAAHIAGIAQSIEKCLRSSVADSGETVSDKGADEGDGLTPAPTDPVAGPSVNVEHAGNVTAAQPPVKGGSPNDAPQEVAQTKSSFVSRAAATIAAIVTPLSAAGIKLGGFSISTGAVYAMCAFGIVGLLVGAWIWNESAKRAARLTELQLLNRARPSEINVELKQ